jgi:peptide/nickel transport system substrate-binding protein
MRVPTTALLALLAAGGLAACGGASKPAAAAPSEFIDVVAALPRSLDPAEEQGAAFERVETSLAGTLVRPAAPAPGAATLAPAGRMVAFLASSWRALPDGDYLFGLRRGVRSPYGHTLSAADVSFSFRRELALSADARVLAGLGRIDTRDPVTVLGPDRVRVNVTGPSQFTLAVLGHFRFGVLDGAAVRAHEGAADPRAQDWLAGHLAFYGAYELLGFAPASKLLLRANPHFWRPLAFALVAIEAAPSPALRLEDVASAAASHTDQLDWGDFVIAAHTSGLRALMLPSGSFSALVPDERSRPFSSVLVRRALSLAIDRGAIARAAFAGLAAPALHPTPATFAPLAGVTAPVYAHDVALARALLARAGYPHGFSFVLGVGPDATAAELGAIAGQLRAVGVTFAIRRVAADAQLAALERAGRVAAVLETEAEPVASAAFAILAEDVHSSPANFERYDSPALDALAGALEAGTPGAALAHALAIVADTLPVIPLVEVPDQVVSQDAIGGYAAYPTAAVYYDQLSR